MKRVLKYGIILIIWLFIWQIGSLIVGLPLLFPSPIDVVKRLGELIIISEFWKSSLTTLLRIGAGIICSTVIATLISVICAINKYAYDFFYPFITIIKSTPVASFIILVWVFIGNNITPIIISALIVFPIIWSNVYQGIKNVNHNLIEVCKIYNIPFKKRLISLYIPSVIPHFYSALLSAIGLAWKAGIAAEILCTPKNSIGINIFNAKTYFEYVDLFAWTLAVIILSLIFEVLVTKGIKFILKKKKMKSEVEE